MKRPAAAEPEGWSGRQPVRPVRAPEVVAAKGEHLIHSRDRANVRIKIGSATGSSNLPLGTLWPSRVFQPADMRDGLILNDVRHRFDKGASIFILKNSWHGFENPHHELVQELRYGIPVIEALRSGEWSCAQRMEEITVDSFHACGKKCSSPIRHLLQACG